METLRMKSEREVQARIMLALGRGLSRVFRNNVGVLPDATGRPIRYGIQATVVHTQAEAAVWLGYKQHR